MCEENKKKEVNIFLNNIYRFVEKEIAKGKYEKAMAAISIAGEIQYQFNQEYVDTDLEKNISLIAKKIKPRYENKISELKVKEKNILFYDGFGLDTRGEVLMYLNALKKNGYHVIYVTDKNAVETQPEVHKLMKDADIIWEYINMNDKYTAWMRELTDIIIKRCPKAMFFYTKPNDVSGAVSFSLFEGKIDRHLIDLTDHAFWIGVNCNDYFLGSREMSASNQFFKRHIPKEKLIKLGVNLIVDRCDTHEKLPFDVTKARYIFSGGALYKTLGEEQNTYYKIVDHILQYNKDIKFLYAGFGDDSEMVKILEKYPDRAYLVGERKDYYYLIENCTLYLNTYPMFGGMMMKYSANAGKIPITLRHNADSDGLLLNQQEARIEYDTYQDLVEDVDKLLSDESYLKEREALLEGTVITEQRFVNNVRGVIEKHQTDYEHEVIEIDTSEFQKEFYLRFDLEEQKYKSVNYINRSLYGSMPWMNKILIKKFMNKLTRKNHK